MLTVARQADLSLPEFIAFNHGLSLPWMRRWELPFALFQSRLGNTMTVLDCTINPAGMRERMAALYPHTYYLHISPIQNGQFIQPFGAPDASFDRVLCINTLEHLLRPQREALLAAMAHKLKPGGWLVLTSDYYFDSAWSSPAFLQSGLLRSDQQEVFNGFNRLTHQEWIELCARHGLRPLGDPNASPAVENPREDDPSLYRQQPPFAHACIGGVFVKGEPTAPPPGKHVMLSLLTWNTREISLESARALIREAYLLRRLGYEPSLCFCDNGSTDDTPAALESLQPELGDLPYKFIFNRLNRGSSIARNQVIDHMLEQSADYLLFMDGDIECVPFSSFAMLRYMENQGSQLGCIGAHSHWQTPYRERASPCLYSIDRGAALTTNLVAWTQYGMFRRELFAAGVRFDETDPFNQAGWGFEDNDLAFQMDMQGFANQYFSGMIYLHRNVHSSLRILRESGHDPALLYNRRRQYLIDKWAATPRISNGPLVDVRRVVLPH